MVTILDTLSRAGDKPRPRHPEKAHQPDTPVLPKPDWIRVKAVSYTHLTLPTKA